MWLGSTAAEREGVFYHLSQNDHPAFGLNSDPKRLTLGSSHVVGITRKRVKNIMISSFLEYFFRSEKGGFQ